MKRIVWLFGDGSTQYTGLDPKHRLEGETEQQQIKRYKVKVGQGLEVSPLKTDLTFRKPGEQAAYVAALGAGAKATFAGVISESEYMAKVNSIRQYREAWTWITPDPVIDFDMTRARDIHRHWLRRLRAPKFATLDAEYMKALEVSDTLKLAELAAKKQALRDAPAYPAIDAATTPEELKAAIPPSLAT